MTEPEIIYYEEPMTSFVHCALVNNDDDSKSVVITQRFAYFLFEQRAAAGLPRIDAPLGTRDIASLDLAKSAFMAAAVQSMVIMPENKELSRVFVPTHYHNHLEDATVHVDTDFDNFFPSGPMPPAAHKLYNLRYFLLARKLVDDTDGEACECDDADDDPWVDTGDEGNSYCTSENTGRYNSDLPRLMRMDWKPTAGELAYPESVLASKQLVHKGLDADGKPARRIHILRQSCYAISHNRERVKAERASGIMDTEHATVIPKCTYADIVKIDSAMEANYQDHVGEWCQQDTTIAECIPFTRFMTDRRKPNLFASYAHVFGNRPLAVAETFVKHVFDTCTPEDDANEVVSAMLAPVVLLRELQPHRDHACQHRSVVYTMAFLMNWMRESRITPYAFRHRRMTAISVCSSMTGIGSSWGVWAGLQRLAFIVKNCILNNFVVALQQIEYYPLPEDTSAEVKAAVRTLAFHDVWEEQAGTVACIIMKETKRAAEATGPSNYDIPPIYQFVLNALMIPGDSALDALRNYATFICRSVRSLFEEYCAEQKLALPADDIMELVFERSSI